MYESASDLGISLPFFPITTPSSTKIPILVPKVGVWAGSIHLHGALLHLEVSQLDLPQVKYTKKLAWGRRMALWRRRSACFKV